MNELLKRAVNEAIHQATGERFDEFTTTASGGGCINQTCRLRDDTRSFFLKQNSAALLPVFQAEHDALAIIAQTDTIRVPHPIALGTAGDISFLILEYLPLGRADAAAHEKLGEQLAELHRHTSASGRHGWASPNFIGSTPQPNVWHEDWLTFWRDERLGHQFRLAEKDGHPFKNADRLLNHLDQFLADHRPAPCLLHGDLWGGNLAFTTDAVPVIYDPASYYGDRETDLAMTRLFGSLPAAFYGAYHATYPLPDGQETRQTLYNLYHVLNHAHLFGGGYISQAQSMIDALL